MRSDGGFEATGPAEAEGDGDVWCGTTATAAAPAGTAGTAKIPGDADNVGASEGVDRGSGVVVAPECGWSWTDVGCSTQIKICIVGGDQGCADRVEPASRGTREMGAKVADTEVADTEVVPHPDPGRQYVGWVDRRWQVRWDGGSSRAATLEAGDGIDSNTQQY